MIKVSLRGSESAEALLKRFKKACEKEGLTKDMKKNAYYEKPSEINRRRRKNGDFNRMIGRAPGGGMGPGSRSGGRS